MSDHLRTKGEKIKEIKLLLDNMSLKPTDVEMDRIHCVFTTMLWLVKQINSDNDRWFNSIEFQIKELKKAMGNRR